MGLVSTLRNHPRWTFIISAGFLVPSCSPVVFLLIKDRGAEWEWLHELVAKFALLSILGWILAALCSGTVLALLFLRWVFADVNQPKPDLAATPWTTAGWFSVFVLLSEVVLVLFGILLLRTRAENELPYGSDRQAFFSSRWQSDESTARNSRGRTARQEMLKDAIEQAVVGKKRDDVIYLLGKPFSNGDATELCFYLGGEREPSFFSMKQELLCLTFDETEHVDQYHIRLFD